jgi:hypothetical protein
MNERAKLPDPLFAASEFSKPKPGRRDDQEALTNVIASHWPESRSLLETLEPEARNHYLPELSIAVVQRDPAAALALVEAEGGWEKHPHAITAFAEAFAASDPTAATAWAERLPQNIRTIALPIVERENAGWIVK